MDHALYNALLWLVPLFFLTALVYSSAGFAGGSTYLALLVLTGIPMVLLPSIALSCNIVVALTGFALYVKERRIDLRMVLPFLIGSVPMAYVGGRIPIGREEFMLLLGLSLFVASLRLVLPVEGINEGKRPIEWLESFKIGIPIGAVLGFVSGLTGIGGGIFLAPVLYLLGWGGARRIAAAANVFILVNSFSGLTGQLVKNSFRWESPIVIPLVLAVFVGGLLGTRLGINGIRPVQLKQVTAGLVLFVSLNVLWRWFSA